MLCRDLYLRYCFASLFAPSFLPLLYSLPLSAYLFSLGKQALTDSTTAFLEEISYTATFPPSRQDSLIKELQSKIYAFEDRVDELSAYRSQALVDLDQKSQEIHGLRDQVALQRVKIESREAVIEVRESEIMQSQKHIRRLQRELDGTKTRILEMDTTIKDVEAQASHHLEDLRNEQHISHTQTSSDFQQTKHPEIDYSLSSTSRTGEVKTPSETESNQGSTGSQFHMVGTVKLPEAHSPKAGSPSINGKDSMVSSSLRDRFDSQTKMRGWTLPQPCPSDEGSGSREIFNSGIEPGEYATKNRTGSTRTPRRQAKITDMFAKLDLDPKSDPADTPSRSLKRFHALEKLLCQNK
ncbi:MAG: hypothetical protein Q9216_003126 [Gyalolechia sp. 2 TL-2023]